MKRITKKTLLVAAIVMAAMCVPSTASAQFGGIVNKAKDKAKETVDKKKKDVKKDAKAQAEQAKMQAIETQRPDLPWTMADKGTYNGMDVEEFVSQMECCEIIDVNTLRKKMFARYNHNKTILAAGVPDNKLKESVEKEQERFLDLYYIVKSKLNLLLTNLPDPVVNGDQVTFDISNTIWFLRGHMTSYAVVEENGKAFFRNYLSGDKAFLDEEDMVLANATFKCVSNYGMITYNLMDELEKGSKDYDQLWHLNSRANMYADRLKKAIDGNSPENIEFRAMPKAGSMNGKFKAEALSIAKAQNKDVIDVIITSNDWDVKMKGLVPSHRSIYGYIVTQDKYGKKCSSRAWSQSYEGNGNYGKLRAGGVGVEQDFYVK